MLTEYDAFFTMLAEPKFERRLPSEDGRGELLTYVLQSCGILMPVRPHLMRDIQQIIRVSQYVEALPLNAFLDEMHRDDSPFAKAAVLLTELEDALPETLVLTDVGRMYVATFVSRIIQALLEYCRDSQAHDESINRCLHVINQCFDSQCTALKDAIAYTLETSDRERAEHAQALEYALETYLAAYFAALCEAMQVRYCVAMQARYPLRAPALPTMEEILDFIAAFGVLPLRPAEDEDDAMLVDALECVSMYLFMLQALTTQWGGVPAEAFLYVSTLACMLGCESRAAEAFAICRRYAVDTLTEREPLYAELDAIFCKAPPH